MKSIGFLMILFSVAIKAASQQTVPVFQVIYAENALLNNGTNLKSLDKLTDEIIHVSDSGYLVLIHETGIPVEFNADTTIMLSEIHAILNPKSVGEQSSYQKSVGLDYLFLSQAAEAKRFRLKRTGAIHDDRPAHLIYPPLINRKIYFDEDVKIVLKSNFIGIDLIVKVMNVYNDELRSYEVKDSFVLIPEEELNYQDIDCIITFGPTTEKRSKGKNSAYGNVISRFYTNKIDFPYSAKVKTPAAALMAGYFFELASWEASEEAQSYYELATRLSDNKFYKEMLSNYLKRTSQ
jgi:hypothetical protein